MAINWSVESMTREQSTGGVVTVVWKAVDEDSAIQTPIGIDIPATLAGKCDFSPDPSAAGFIPFDDLLEPEVLGWVYSEVDKDEMERQIAAMIEADRRKREVYVDGTPWDAAPVDPVDPVDANPQSNG